MIMRVHARRASHVTNPRLHGACWTIFRLPVLIPDVDFLHSVGKPPVASCLIDRSQWKSGTAGVTRHTVRSWNPLTCGRYRVAVVDGGRLERPVPSALTCPVDMRMDGGIEPHPGVPDSQPAMPLLSVMVVLSDREDRPWPTPAPTISASQFTISCLPTS